MTQVTVNERLNFLINELKMSARAFSAAIGMPDSNTRNYLTKGTKLNSEYLESIASHFSHVDLNWLLTGKGEPFLPNPAHSSDSHNISTKNFQGNVAGTNHGNMSQLVSANATLPDCEKELDASRREIELLRRQLLMAEALIAAKDETLALLRGSHNRPN